MTQLVRSYNFKLISFADGSYLWRQRGKRFKRNADKSRFFKETVIYNSTLLKDISSKPKNIENIFRRENPGYGYWLWKPLIIKKELDKLESKFDGLVYIDSGCDFNINLESSRRMNFYFQYALEKKILTFHLPGFIEKEWTSNYVLETLKVSEDKQNSFQRLGGIIFFANSEKSREIVDHWLNLCIYADSRLLKGNKIGESEIHRYDQSLWSLTTKLFEIPSLSDETFHAPNWKTQGKNYPIWARRKSKKINSYINLLLNLFT